MESIVNIKLEPELQKMIEANSRQKNINPEELVKNILRDYLFLEKLDITRKKYQEKMKQMGFNNEDDIFNAVS